MDSAMKIIELKINIIIIQHHSQLPKMPTQTNHARGIERTFGLV